MREINSSSCASLRRGNAAQSLQPPRTSPPSPSARPAASGGQAQARATAHSTSVHGSRLRHAGRLCGYALPRVVDPAQRQLGADALELRSVVLGKVQEPGPLILGILVVGVPEHRHVLAQLVGHGVPQRGARRAQRGRSSPQSVHEQPRPRDASLRRARRAADHSHENRVQHGWRRSGKAVGEGGCRLHVCTRPLILCQVAVEEVSSAGGCEQRAHAVSRLTVLELPAQVCSHGLDWAGSHARTAISAKREGGVVVRRGGRQDQAASQDRGARARWHHFLKLGERQTRNYFI
eukprot:scaffold56327_cov68-Phaeocystis_antarctica.AAC.4